MNTITPKLSRRAAVISSLAGGMLAALPAQGQTPVSTKQATISVDSAVTTLVNLLTVEPEKQPALIALLHEGIDTQFSKMPGWISTAVLADRNQRQVVVYSQWRDAGDIEAFRKDPDLQPYFQRIAALARQQVLMGDVDYCLHA